MKRVVIIGGGFAGSTVASKLEKKFNVTLVDAKDYFEFTPGILRTIIYPNHSDKIQAFHRHYLKKASFVKGKVSSISKKSVSVNDQELRYDYLVICSGSKYSPPIKESGIILANHVKNLAEKHNDIKNSEKILIIGGGLVGVELAGEICTGFKGKAVTIVHAMDKLIERNPARASAYARRFLEKQGIY